MLQHSYLAQHLTSKYFEVHKQTTLRNLKSKDVPTASHLITDRSEFVTHTQLNLFMFPEDAAEGGNKVQNFTTGSRRKLPHSVSNQLSGH